MEYMTMTRNESVEYKMFDRFFNMGLFVTSVVEIETKFLQGQNLNDFLYINEYKIRTIRKQTFVDLPIRVLKFMANKIITIEEQAFVNLTRLERISLARNQLTELDLRNFVDLPSLRDFDACINKIS
jgi:hypothetical protein